MKNFFKSNGLNQYHFQEFLNSLNSGYDEVIFYIEVRWMAHAKI